MTATKPPTSPELAELEAMVGGFSLEDLLDLAGLVVEVLSARTSEAEARDILELALFTGPVH